MKTRAFLLAATLCGGLLCASDVQAQAHRGQVDTDGVLSPGEIPNPHINYGNHGYGHRCSGDRHGGYDYDHYHDHYNGHYEDRYDDRGRYDSFNAALSNGIRSGRISRREQSELESEAAELRDRRRAYLADGRLSDGERHDLENRQEHLDDELRHELNDGEHRW
jgi:hypothetical protein